MKKFIALLLLRNAIRLRKQIFGLNHLDIKDDQGNLGFTRPQPIETINKPKTITITPQKET